MGNLSKELHYFTDYEGSIWMGLSALNLEIPVAEDYRRIN